MNQPSDIPRLKTGIRNLDSIIHGGLPKGSVSVVSGAPGSGKTILCQQISFHSAAPDFRVLFVGTLSEPTVKSLRYMQQFTFFDPKKLEQSVQLVDLGVILRSDGLEKASAQIMDHVRRFKPSIVVVDSFKVFDDLAHSQEALRKFSYEIVVSLMAWETTVFLIGEYGSGDYENNPLFSIVDGLIVLSQRESAGEHQRFLKVIKMRGTDHSRDEHAFTINQNGIEVFAPKLAIMRDPKAGGALQRCQTHISRLDEILGPGIPLGSSLLISGVAGTGKTVLSLEFIYRGALAGEKGIFFSFEETEERLRATARGLGWDLEREIERGMVEIVFIPQPEIMVEAHLLMIRERVEAMAAKRVSVDSISVFLHKLRDPQLDREKVFQLCSIIQNAQAVGFFSTDIPYGTSQISRFGVEETVVDGVVLVTATEEGMERQRYIEVYKLRNTAHLKGRHNMTITSGGVLVFPRYGDLPTHDLPPPAFEMASRLGSGIPGLDPLLGGGLLRRSITLFSGSAGIGKSTVGMQFILEGAKNREPGLLVTLEEGPEQLLVAAHELGIPLRQSIDEGLVEIFYVSRAHFRAGQYLAVLASKIQERKAQRLVLDGVLHLVPEPPTAEAFRVLLYNLTVRFKMLGVTSLLTLEAPTLSSLDPTTERGLSPIADNLIALRYRHVDEQLVPMLTIIKTRGTPHDRAAHAVAFGKGGMRVEGRSAGKPPRAKKATARK